MELNSNYSVIIPTFNPGNGIDQILFDILNQDKKPKEIIVIDSDSDDDVKSTCLKYGAVFYKIQRSNFNHGSTREKALDLISDVDFVIYITQDIEIVDNKSFGLLIDSISCDSIGAVCGRQLPHHNANPNAQHLRLFNYPENDRVVSCDEVKNYGVKAAFLSNSFSAYRLSALEDVGGFPNDVILGEDTYVAAKMLEKGWKIAYSSKAIVRHSHNYTLFDELKRYFDIGVFHQKNSWYLNFLSGTPNSEGKKYVLSELKFTTRQSVYWGMRSVFLSSYKLLGYRLGRAYQKIPKKLIDKLTMHKGYWE